MGIFTQTPRLFLRSLEERDLPRLVELIGDWDVTQWLGEVPHPYDMKNAEEFLARMTECQRRGVAECFVIASREDNGLMGVMGLHPSRENAEQEEIVLGYWLGKPYWGNGFMGEAVNALVPYAFKLSGVKAITATTDPKNYASQNVLHNAGFFCLGTYPRPEGSSRGGAEVMRWRLENSQMRAIA